MDIKILGLKQSYGNDRLGRADAGDTAGAVTKSSGSSATAGSTADRVTLSGDARLVAQAAKEAQEAPDVRTEKVASLKAQVQAGTYQPDSRKIAEKMLTMESDLFG